MIRSQSGFSTFTILALLPLIISIISVLWAVFAILKQDGVGRQSCRLQLLTAQAQVAVDLKNLLAMNKGAASLRMERQEAEGEMLAAYENPTAAPFAEAHLQAVISKQEAYGFAQRQIINKARLESQLAPGKALVKIRGGIFAQGQNQQPGSAVRGFQSDSKEGRFAVVPEPPDSPTPDYQPASDFRSQQEMKLKWSFDAASVLPNWLKPFIQLAQVQAQAECSTTIEKDENQWQPRITVAKSPSSY